MTERLLLEHSSTASLVKGATSVWTGVGGTAHPRLALLQDPEKDRGDAVLLQVRQQH